MNRCDRSHAFPSTVFSLPARIALAALIVAGAAPLVHRLASARSPRRIGRRTALRRLLAGAGATALAGWAVPAHAGSRVFPMGARRGQIVFTSPPQVQLDGKPEQLGPGTRIHDAANNRLIFASTLKGQSLIVNYVRDGAGTIRDIWILTPGEIQEKLPPTPQELQNQQQWLQNAPPVQMPN